MQLNKFNLRFTKYIVQSKSRDSLTSQLYYKEDKTFNSFSDNRCINFQTKLFVRTNSPNFLYIRKNGE